MTEPQLIGYTISIAGGFALGIIYETRERAEEMAEVYLLTNYTIEEAWYPSK